MPLSFGKIFTRRNRSGKKASVVNPASVPGLATWFKFRSLGLNDGDLISICPDSSGNGLDLTEAGGTRPTFKTNIQNGLSVARFNPAATTSMRTPEYDRAQPETIFVVCKSNVAQNSLLDGPTPGSLNKGRIFFYDSGGFQPCSMFAGSGLANAAATSGGWHILTCVFNGASSKFRVDGGNQVAGNPGTDATALGMRIGSDGSSSIWFDGDIGEIVTYAAVPSAQNIAGIEAYLNSIWAAY